MSAATDYRCDRLCRYSLPHRNRTDHHCDCVCALPEGHLGTHHLCAFEARTHDAEGEA